MCCFQDLDENVESHGEAILQLLDGTPSAFPGQIRQAATSALTAFAASDSNS